MSQRIVCAANKYTIDFSNEPPETLIITGARHYDKIMRQQINALDEYYWSCKTEEVQGFIDQFGNFLTREEAYIIAKENGQIIRECGNPNSVQLFSEHLY
jgi:hypothetical protein